MVGGGPLRLSISVYDFCFDDGMCGDRVDGSCRPGSNPQWVASQGEGPDAAMMSSSLVPGWWMIQSKSCRLLLSRCRCRGQGGTFVLESIWETRWCLQPSTRARAAALIFLSRIPATPTEFVNSVAFVTQVGVAEALHDLGISSQAGASESGLVSIVTMDHEYQ